ncbi:MAG TPA: polyketide synthase [Kiritimatiellia bacterium]|nr:polyketide synthase [Kiritimatiellia bacterium]
MKLHQDDVAIIGVAGRFAQAPDAQSLWENILAGVCAIGTHPDPDIQRYYDPDSEAFERIYTTRGAFLGDLATFDPLEFGVMPDSLVGVEPDHFLALKVAKDALVDAGLEGKAFPRERTDVILGHGVYINPSNVNWIQHGLVLDQTVNVIRDLFPGISKDDLERVHRTLKGQLPPLNAQSIPAMIPNVIAGRIANRLDLMGANYIVDAACASSLVALSHGVNHLLLDRCDVALVGGVQACMLAQDLMTFCQIDALSRRDDAPRPFDADADGTLFGEGVGMAVLKRRRDAERDGDRIYAVIKGYGISSDGKSSGLLAPRLEGEKLAIGRAYETSGVDPRSVGLIEAHATGIPLGDSIELHALTDIYGSRQGSPTCGIGSVKSMIGHCVPAAGIASVIKAAFALYHKILPPTANFSTPHPKLKIEDSPFYVLTEPRPWLHTAATPRRAGVSAMGFGGINSHVLLEEVRA